MEKLFRGIANPIVYHVRTLSVDCPECVVERDAEEGGWIRVLPCVKSLVIGKCAWPPNTFPLAPFRGLSSTLKSLSVNYIMLPSPQLVYLICSSPLLEDLTVAGRNGSSGDDNDPRRVPPGVPSTSPPLSGSLDLNIYKGIGSTVRQLLDLPNGLHFRKLTLSWDIKEDLWWITRLVRKCSHALEFLYVSHSSDGVFI